MAANYGELVIEIKTWLDRDDTVLDSVIPTFIRQAESWFARELHTREMECRLNVELLPDGTTEEDRGVYDLPPDWGGHKTVERIGDRLWTTYWQKIPNLDDTTVTENWLLTKYPDLYLYAALSHAEPFLKNDSRAQLWSDVARNILDGVIGHDNHDRFSGDPPRTITPGHKYWRNAGGLDGRLHYLPVYDFYDLKFSGLQEGWLKYPGYFTVTEDFLKIWPKP